MSKFSSLNFGSNLSQRVWQQWQVLSSREKLLLGIMAGFLFVIALYGTWQLHQQAVTQKQQYEQKINDYFWLRTQSANLIENTQQTANNQPMQVVINDMLQKSGIKNAKVATSGDVIQLAFTHDSQAVIGTVFGKLEQMGMPAHQLRIKQDASTKALTVQATFANTDANRSNNTQ